MISEGKDYVHPKFLWAMQYQALNSQWGVDVCQGSGRKH